MSNNKTIGTFALLAVACLTVMVGCVIVPGLPNISAQLGFSNYSNWLVTLPSLGVVLFGPITGKLITRFGSRITLRIGLICYGFFGFSCIFLQRPPIIIIDRLLLGAATAMVMTAGTLLLSELHSGSMRLKIIAYQGMSIELGGVIFLFIGGVLASIGWKWPFMLYLVSWILLILIEVYIPHKTVKEQNNKSRNIEEQNNGLNNNKLYYIYLFALFSMITFFSAIITLPQSLNNLGYSEVHVGYFLSFISLVAVFVAFLLPKIAMTIGNKNTLSFGFICYALAQIGFGFGGELIYLIFFAMLLGSGFGLTIPLVNHLTIEYSSQKERGKALAWLSVAIFLGQFLSSFLAVIPGNANTIYFLSASLALFAIIMSRLK